jgi:hypothetical protein
VQCIYSSNSSSSRSSIVVVIQHSIIIVGYCALLISLCGQPSSDYIDMAVKRGNGGGFISPMKYGYYTN